MEYVREKQRAVQKWMVQAGREGNEYRARTSTFQRALENDVPLMIAQLGRMIDAIEGYSETASMVESKPVASISNEIPAATILVEPNQTERPAADVEQTETNDNARGMDSND